MFSTMYTLGEQNSGTMNLNYFSSLKWFHILKLTSSLYYISSVAKFLMSCLILAGSVGTIYIALEDMELIIIALGGDFWTTLEESVQIWQV